MNQIAVALSRGNNVLGVVMEANGNKRRQYREGSMFGEGGQGKVYRKAPWADSRRMNRSLPV